MATLGRNDLLTQRNTNVPDNTVKFITPARHRSVLADHADSHFNLVDDDANQVSFDNTSTDFFSTDVDGVLREIDGFSVKILAYADFAIGNFKQVVGTPITVSNNFQITDCDVAEVRTEPGSQDQARYLITMNDIGTTNYIVMHNFIYQSGSMNDNNNMLNPVYTNYANDSFEMAIAESRGLTQDFVLRVSLIKLG